jgi:hypothetical protein
MQTEFWQRDLLESDHLEDVVKGLRSNIKMDLGELDSEDDWMKWIRIILNGNFRY